MDELLLASAVVVVAAAIQGSVGFGMNALSFPILLAIDDSLVPGPLLIAHLSLVLMMSASEMSQRDSRALAWAVGGSIPGVAAGAWLISLASKAQLVALAIAALVLVIVVVLRGVELGRGRGTLAGVGVLSGLLGTTVSVNGPPLALALISGPGAVRRGTMAVFLTIGTAFSIVALIGVGRFGSSELVSGLALVPAAGIGMLIAVSVHSIVDRIDARLVVIPLAVVSAVIGVAGIS